MTIHRYFISVFKQPLKPNQPGHPSVDRHKAIIRVEKVTSVWQWVLASWLITCSWFKVLGINRPSGRHKSYTSLIGSTDASSKERKEMSCY